jgi:hypothetical protein
MNKILLFGMVFFVFAMFGCTNVGKAIQTNTMVSDNCLKGDINKDGTVDDKDLVLINAFLNKDIEFNGNQLFCADMNNDGIVNIDDKAAMLLEI